MSPLNKKTILYSTLGIAGALVFIVLLVGVGAGDYYIGYFKGKLDGVALVNLSIQNKLKTKPGLAQSKTKGAKSPKNQRPGTQKSTPPSAAKKTDLSPTAGLNGGLSGLEGLGGLGDSQDVEAQLGQLETLLGKMAPGPAPEAKVSTQALALVKEDSSNSNGSVKDYLKTVDTILAKTESLDPQAMISGVKAGDSATFDQAIRQLDGAFKELKGIGAPKRCINLHGLYLTLLPQLKNLMQLQQKAMSAGDPTQLLEGLVLAQEVMALNKAINQKRKEIRISLKG